MKPSIGRIVLVQREGLAFERPAIVTQVHNDTRVDVEVFGLGYRNPDRLLFSVCMEDPSADGANKLRTSWRWPPRVA